MANVDDTDIPELGPDWFATAVRVSDNATSGVSLAINFSRLRAITGDLTLRHNPGLSDFRYLTPPAGRLETVTGVVTTRAAADALLRSIGHTERVLP